MQTHQLAFMLATILSLTGVTHGEPSSSSRAAHNQLGMSAGWWNARSSNGKLGNAEGVQSLSVELEIIMARTGHRQSQLDRRVFIGTGMAAAFATAGRNASAQPESGSIGNDPKGRSLPYNPRTFEAMPTRNLGQTGHRVGIFSLGGQAVVETSDQDQAEAIVNKAIDLGVNYIDTASSYGGGKSEQNIGRVMKHRRGDVYLASKTQRMSRLPRSSRPTTTP